MAKIFAGFGCHVICHDPYPAPDLPFEYVALADLFAAADIITLHCPLTPQTHHLVDEPAIATMKAGVMLINTSRGAVINTRDAINALKSGQLGYLGMDVYEQEEKLFFRDLSESIIEDDVIARLMTFPNVLITAHQGFFTNEAFEQIATVTLQNITDIEKDNHCANEVLYRA